MEGVVRVGVVVEFEGEGDGIVNAVWVSRDAQAGEVSLVPLSGSLLLAAVILRFGILDREANASFEKRREDIHIELDRLQPLDAVEALISGVCREDFHGGRADADVEVLHIESAERWGV